MLLLMTVGFSFSGKSQDVALKSNALFWGATTPNLGIEVACSPKVTIDLWGAYNPWTFRNDKKMRFWLVQPEGKYWFCEKFEGHFVGFHLHGAQFFGGFKEKRYDGLPGQAAASATATIGYSLPTGTWKPRSV